MPFSDATMRDWGYVAWRVFTDGTVWAVAPMLNDNGRLFVDIHETGYDDFYCYDGLKRAIDCMMRFDPTREKEPDGWKRHFLTGRRRPDGDGTKEFVNF